MPEEIIISVKVIPKAHQNEIVGWENGELKVRIKAVPQKGCANDMLIAFLSKELNISKSNIQLIKGSSSRHKKIRLFTNLSKLALLEKIKDF